MERVYEITSGRLGLIRRSQQDIDEAIRLFSRVSIDSGRGGHSKLEAIFGLSLGVANAWPAARARYIVMSVSITGEYPHEKSPFERAGRT